LKKIFCIIIATVLLMCDISSVWAQEPQIETPSAIVMEASTMTVIYEKNADEMLPPASVTKIMTLLLIFDALEAGTIKLTDEVTVSENAASMGGSQVFLEPMEKQTVDTMIKCIAVASANDASVAMAEHICGSEEAFVAKMNERAKTLSMTNTHFVNCCGLDTDGHETTARDIALMSRELITKYPQIYNYSTIWMDTITHSTRRGDSEFGLTNTNKLVKQMEGTITGLKTGSTSIAKCCLSATASKNGIDLIAVILAAPNSKTRFSDAVTLINYGYGICSMYSDENMPALEEVPIKDGIKDKVTVRYAGDFKHLFTESIDKSKVESRIEYIRDIKAPVNKGDVLGKIVYSYDGKEIGSVDIQAAEGVKKASFKDCIRKIYSLYFC